MTIKEYWNLIGWEPFLAITWEPDFSQACNFRRMKMNHMSFLLHQFQTKLWLDFLKKSKSPVFGPPLTIFGHFFPIRWRFFPKNLAVTHNYIWAPNTMLNFRKNQWPNSEKTNGQTEGRTDRHYFIGFFRPRPVIQ